MIKIMKNNFISSHYKLYLIGIGLLFLGFITYSPSAHAAVVVAQQVDGSLSGSVTTDCNNSCSHTTVGSQIFVPSTTANLGSLEIFTSNFRTNSSNPATNNCYINIYNQDT